SPCGKWALRGTSVYSTRDGKRRYEGLGEKDIYGPTRITFSPAGTALIAAQSFRGGGKGRVPTLGLADGKAGVAIPFSRDGFEEFAFSPDGRTLAVLSGDGGKSKLSTYEVATGKEKLSGVAVWRMAGHSRSAAQFDPSGSRLLIAPDD